MSEPFNRPAERRPARIGALPSLPVFFRLTGRRAVVVGGSGAAAWKAELLAASGADVVVYAPLPGEEMLTLAGHDRAAGNVTVIRRPWTPSDLAQAVLVVADAETAGEAEALRMAASEAGVSINVIDRPDCCDFLFGSIVNRSPVVVSISTDGAAPVLGQAIRRRIEALLPGWIGTWAAAAHRLRGAIAELIENAARRRRFWDQFAETAFSVPTPRDADTDVLRLAKHAAANRGPTGRVTFVGAGPGDPELLTFKAVRALQSADVILLDDFVPDAVLELARREAQRLPASRRYSSRQIAGLMIGLAQEGKHVVRLKPGDPSAFGCAADEIDALERENVVVELVPGLEAGFTTSHYSPPGWGDLAGSARAS